ncbi:hypothetical protein BCR44DRAFT_1428226, partial [Catenaria anguillulae PL171]
GSVATIFFFFFCYTTACIMGYNQLTNFKKEEAGRKRPEHNCCKMSITSKQEAGKWQ